MPYNDYMYGGYNPLLTQLRRRGAPYDEDLNVPGPQYTDPNALIRSLGAPGGMPPAGGFQPWVEAGRPTSPSVGFPSPEQLGAMGPEQIREATSRYYYLRDVIMGEHQRRLQEARQMGRTPRIVSGTSEQAPVYRTRGGGR